MLLPPTRRPCGALRLSAATSLALLTACVAYVPAPLALEAFGDAWLEGRAEPHDSETASSPTAEVWGRERAEAELLVRSRPLASLRQQVAIARAGAEFAGLAPDPQLSLAALYSLDAGDDPWIFSAGLAWAWPFAHLRDARVDRAEAAVRARAFELAAAELDALGDLGIAWASLRAATTSVTVEQRFLDEFERLAQSLEALANAGEATALDAGLARLEARRAVARVELAQADLAQRLVETRNVLALPPDGGITLAPDQDPPFEAPESCGPLPGHPRLAAARARYEVAEQTLRREVAEQFPGINLGPRFEQEEGSDRLGGGLTIPLPLWNRNRGGIAIAHAERDAARVAAESTWITIEQARHRQRIELDNARRVLDEIESHVVPEVTAQIDNARRLIEAGEAQTALLLDVLRQARQTELTRNTARARAERAAADLRRWWSPPAEPDAAEAHTR